MRTTRIALLTGAAALVFAGFAGAAEARTAETHVLSLYLPGGQVEHIHYMGNVPPMIFVSPDAMAPGMAAASFDPGFPFGTPDAANLGVPAASFNQGSPFGMMDRLAAAIDQQAEMLVRDVNTLAAQTMPSATGYGTISAGPGAGLCMRSVQITYSGNGQAPRVVSHTSGDCGSMHGQPAPAALPNTPVLKQVPAVVQAKADLPYQSLVHPVSDQQR